MPIRLTKNEDFSVKFRDNLSGEDVMFYFRPPTTKERVAYQNDSARRVKNKFEFRVSEAQFKHGLGILTGIRDGDFELPAAVHESVLSGKIQPESDFIPISSDSTSPYYVSNWKDAVAESANHLIIALGAHVFGNPTEDGETKDTPENP